MAELKETGTDEQVAIIIDEFNSRVLKQPDENSVLDASADAAAIHANVYRDYISKHLITKLLRLKAHDTVLDFGCGMGRLAKHLSQMVKHVDGVDRAAEMINVAHQRNHRPNVEFQYLPSHLLPYNDCHFDKVFSYTVLQHINDEELKKVLRELYRVTKPGARVVCLEQTRKTAQWFGQVHLHRTVEQYDQLLSEAGFRRVEIKSVIRHPSYALSAWTRFRFMPSIVLPLLTLVEDATVNRKPELAEYYTTAFIFEKP